MYTQITQNLLLLGSWFLIDAINYMCTISNPIVRFKSLYVGVAIGGGPRNARLKLIDDNLSHGRLSISVKKDATPSTAATAI